jgi:hypothetical protein
MSPLPKQKLSPRPSSPPSNAKSTPQIDFENIQGIIDRSPALQKSFNAEDTEMENLKMNIQHISGIMNTAEHSQSLFTIDQQKEVIINKEGTGNLIGLDNPRGNSLKKNNFVNMSMSSA